MPRLCILTFDPPAQVPLRYEGFFRRLRELGYAEGKTIAIDIKSSDGINERFPELARQCVESRSDLIVATSTPAAQAAKQATSTIPIAMTPLGDPVGSGLIQSFARPGGNVTGLTFGAGPMSGKRLALLKEAMPQLSRVLVLAYGVDPITMPQLAEMRKVAKQLGLTLHVHDIDTVHDLTVARRGRRIERRQSSRSPRVFSSCIASGCWI
jgi:putative ABC transport system substrate-binding protein